MTRIENDTWQNAPDNAGEYNGDPFAEWMPNRARTYTLMNDRQQRLLHSTYVQKANQIKAIQTLSWVSPSGLLQDAMQSLCNTGIYGFETLFEYAKQYRQQLHAFIVERDKIDPDTPHLIYFVIEPGTFSSKPVELSSIPRWHGMWKQGGTPWEQGWPMWQIVILIVANFQMAIIAFIALLCYDPR